jgi:hypothetical protein
VSFPKATREPQPQEIARPSQGRYIQWLDADDLLSPEKIEKQMEAVDRWADPRRLISGPWVKFFRFASRAKPQASSLWCDLSPLEWLLRKLSQNVHMQPGNWLVSRELTESAGPWDTRLSLDDDGEY